MKRFIVLILLSLNASLLCGNNLSGYYFGMGLGQGHVDSGIKALDKTSTIDPYSDSRKIFIGSTELTSPLIRNGVDIGEMRIGDDDILRIYVRNSSGVLEEVSEIE